MKGWKKVKLGNLLSESKIVSEDPDPSKRIRVRLNLQGVEKRPVTSDKRGATKYYVRRAGQFIYGRQNLHKGAFGIVPEELDGFESSLDIPAFDINSAVYPEWIFYYFRKGDFYLKLESLAKGVGSRRINPKQIFDLDIWLPTKEEQSDILERVKLVEKKYKEIINELIRQEELVDTLYQSILQDSVQGKLTELWRKKRTILHSPSKLLASIRQERDKLISEKKIKNEKELNKITDEEVPFKIPDSWEMSRLAYLCYNISSGSTPSKSEFRSDGIPYLKVYNIRNQKIDFDYRPQFINNEVHNGKLKRSKLQPGDVIINIVGPPLGKTAIIPKTFDEWNCNQAIAFFKPIRRSMNKWIYTYLLSELYLKKIELIGTAGQDNISVTKCKNIVIPIPSEKEQEVILTKINNISQSLNNLKISIQDSRKYSMFLLQSALDKIFGYTSPKPVPHELPRELDMTRIKIFDSKTVLMELTELLKTHGRLHAEDLWKMSEYPEDIDAFYAELKKQIENEKTIKEVEDEKGYLELA